MQTMQAGKSLHGKLCKTGNELGGVHAKMQTLPGKVLMRARAHTVNLESLHSCMFAF